MQYFAAKANLLAAQHYAIKIVNWSRKIYDKSRNIHRWSTELNTFLEIIILCKIRLQFPNKIAAMVRNAATLRLPFLLKRLPHRSEITMIYGACGHRIADLLLSHVRQSLISLQKICPLVTRIQYRGLINCQQHKQKQHCCCFVALPDRSFLSEIG